MSDQLLEDETLLTLFVAAFSAFDDLVIHDPAQELPAELADGLDDSRWALRRWKPAAVVTPRSALDDVYRQFPSHFPPLYERLLLSFRWLEVRLGTFVTLYGNPPGPDFQLLVSNITRDRLMAEILFAGNLLPFGRADDDYDSICFDRNRVCADDDSPIVRVEHESILCDGRVDRIWPVADSFRALVQSVVETRP